MADELRQRAGARGPPYDVLKIARALGYEVCVADDLGGPCGLLVGRLILVIRSAEMALTIGHELAHALNDEWRVVPQWPAERLEATMDAVAVALMMPRDDAVLALLRIGDPERVLLFFRPLPTERAAMRLAELLGRLGNAA